MAGVAGQWNGELTIEGKQVTIDLVRIFKEITIRSGVNMDLPSLTLDFFDHGAELINDLGLKDGMKGTVTMGDGGGGELTSSFLMSGNPTIDFEDNKLHVVQKAFLDKPKWQRKTIDKSHMETSGDAIKKIAQDAGLKAVIDTTKDKQVWLPTNKPLSAHVRFIAERGWASAQSAMQLAVTESGVLHYRDLDKLSQKKGSVRIGYDKGDTFHPIDWKILSKATVYNAARGYGSTTAQDPGTGVFQELGKLTAGLMSGSGSIGKSISDAVGGLGRIEFSPIAGGNTHKKYAEAKHQNVRIRGTFSEDCTVMLKQYTGIELMDVVYFAPMDPNTNAKLTNYAGDYIVSAKQRQLFNNQYLEVLTLTSQGMSGPSGN